MNNMVIATKVNLFIVKELKNRCKGIVIPMNILINL